MELEQKIWDVRKWGGLMATRLAEALAAVAHLSEAEQDAIAIAILDAIPRQEGDTNAARQHQPQPQPAPAPEILAYMERQAQQFERLKPQLLQQYRGQYIFFEDGQVLDADRDEAALVLRLYAESGPRPLFIKKVVSEDPILKLRGFVPSVSGQ